MPDYSQLTDRQREIYEFIRSKIETRGYNQEGRLVIRYRRSVMVYKRAHAPRVDIFPEPQP